MAPVFLDMAVNACYEPRRDRHSHTGLLSSPREGTRYLPACYREPVGRGRGGLNASLKAKCDSPLQEAMVD